MELWRGNLRERDHLEERGVNGRQIFKNGDRGHGLDCSGREHGHVTGCCECGNEPSGFIKCGGFLA